MHRDGDIILGLHTFAFFDFGRLVGGGPGGKQGCVAYIYAFLSCQTTSHRIFRGLPTWHGFGKGALSLTMFQTSLDVPRVSEVADLL